MASIRSQATYSRTASVLPFQGIDYIEIYVGNAHRVAHFYRIAFGSTPVAYAGFETGILDCVSFVMTKGDTRLVLTSAVDADYPIAQHVALHNDSVKDIAFSASDTAAAFERAVTRGARPVAAPAVTTSENGRFIKAMVGVYGDTVHSFIQRDGSDDAILPSYQPIKKSRPVGTTDLRTICRFSPSRYNRGRRCSVKSSNVKVL